MSRAHPKAPHRLKVQTDLPGVLIADIAVMLVSKRATERQSFGERFVCQKRNERVDVAFLHVERASERRGVASEQESIRCGEIARGDILTLIPVLGAESHRDRTRPR